MGKAELVDYEVSILRLNIRVNYICISEILRMQWILK